MTIIPRVSPLAQLSGVSGSFLQRKKLADKLSDDSCSWAIETLRKKSQTNKPWGLTLGDIKGYLKKTYPGLKLGVKANEDQVLEASLQRNFDAKNTLRGFLMNLGFSKNKRGQLILDESEKIAGFFHEHRHLCDFIVNPKFSAKKSELREIVKDEKKKAEADDFYGLFLYDYTLEDTMRVVSKPDRRNRIKRNVQDFFRQQGVSSNEKIAILQDWRHSIKTEINATTDEFRQYYKMVLIAKTHVLKKGQEVKLDFSEKLKFDSTKIPPSEREQKLAIFVAKMQKSTMQDQLEGYSFYPDKLKVLESLLASEIKDHRREHALQMRKKPS